ncbi:MAG: hypothetical protein AAF823_05505 [Planctomycetota bacterium]
MIQRLIFLTALSLLTMAGATALVHGGPRGWVVAGACAVLAGYAGLMATTKDDR